MRPVSVPGAVVLFLAFVPSSPGQVGRDVRFIQVEQAEVRSGPSDSPEFYVTNRLRRGQPVEVLGEMPGGWLAIRPPEGSFSWINTRFLRHLYPDMPNHVVTLDGIKVPVFIGSEVLNRRPHIRGAELEPGAQVTSRGKPLADEEGTWMPIEPPARERRFVKAALVARTMPTPGAEVAGVPASTTATATFVSAGSAPAARAPLTAEQLWRQAQQAERQGQVAEAIRLYALFGAETAQSRPDLSSWALQRARYLQGGYQNYGAGVGVAPSPAVPVVNPTGRVYALPASSNSGLHVGPPATPRASEFGAAVTRTTVKQDTSSFTPAPSGSPPRGTPSSWMGYRGVLRCAGRVVEGQKTYALEDSVQLRPILYVSPGAGVNLDGYLNRVVQLWGYTVYRGDLKNNYMIVARVAAE